MGITELLLRPTVCPCQGETGRREELQGEPLDSKCRMLAGRLLRGKKEAPGQEPEGRRLERAPVCPYSYGSSARCARLRGRI